MPRISVCTASYNFRPYLHRVYESLQLQTFKDFEWIIVDDGSEDDTESLVKEWIANKDFFTIRYHRFPENRGKMSATNHGAIMAEGEFFLDFGGDDALKPNALERFMARWDEIDEDVKPEIAALIACSENQYGEFVGTEFPQDPLICDFYERKFKYRIKGEKLQLFKTEVTRRFPYYDKVDRHVIHSATYFDISEFYKIYCFNEVLYTWYVHEKDKVSLSERTHKLRFIKGRQFYAERRINKYLPCIPTVDNKSYVFLFKFLTFVSYIRYSSHMGLGVGEMFRRIQKKHYKLIFCLILPLGLGLILSDRIKKRV
ncbi:MAG: hypothetical protein B6241_01090 [Spirochaetaceae bacterium 4572_59]|nr:MAG: hypothetical protein B6241_01090 [Spirochaetaceae bacterium 4572_59]